MPVALQCWSDAASETMVFPVPVPDSMTTCLPSSRKERMSAMMSSWHPLGSYGMYGASLFSDWTTLGSGAALDGRSVMLDWLLVTKASAGLPHLRQRLDPGASRLLQPGQNSPCMPRQSARGS